MKYFYRLKENLEKYFQHDDGINCLSLAVEYALDSDKILEKRTSREEKKLKCLNMYKSLSRTKMNRAEKIKTIASKMNVKVDCIRVYLRELEGENSAHK